jgi:hypothetical protein
MCLISPVPAQLRKTPFAHPEVRRAEDGWRAGERSGTGTTPDTAGKRLAEECSGTGTTLHTAGRSWLGNAAVPARLYTPPSPLPRRRTPMRRGGENSRSVLQAVSTSSRGEISPRNTTQNKQ